MYKVSVADSKYNIEFVDGKIHVNGNAKDLRIEKTDNGYLIITPTSVIPVKAEKTENQSWNMTLNGQKIATSLKSDFDLLLEKMGLDNMLVAKAEDIKAPMPGLVLDIMANAGAEVKKGDALIVLEAMKMENVIKAAVDGTVKSIDVEKGQAVEKNQVLISFE
ncbi:MAG: acetyl-CoA carboxylase biotin carboxyl carrier protein subunit [Bacteroidetes bacterium]|nr:acetyl-CoA carboxylase biotin carboxyl carrier protein subunit [Bacteroidota bacterium]